MHCKLSHTKALEKFSKALYGITGGTYSARIFRPVMPHYPMDRGQEFQAMATQLLKKMLDVLT